MKAPSLATVPIGVGVLGLIWMITLRWGLFDWPSQALWALYVGAWLATSVALLRRRRVGIAGAALALLAMGAVLGPMRPLASGLVAFTWLGIILAVTDGRPRERALLLRTLVSTGYGFAALVKLNPSFVAGEQVVALARERTQIEWLLPFLESDAGIYLSWSVIALELGLAIGVWFRPTRVPAMAVGIVAHVVFVVAANNQTPWDVAYLIVLNGVFVVCYPAFFAPIRTSPAVVDAPAEQAMSPR